jgi:hypothetical protein
MADLNEVTATTLAEIDKEWKKSGKIYLDWIAYLHTVAERRRPYRRLDFLYRRDRKNSDTP